MNNQEAVGLCRVVKALCPHQAIDEHTPDMWGLVLSDIRFEDAKTAVVNLAKRAPFIAPAEIVAEVKRIREKRLAETPEPSPPDGLSAVEYVKWLRAERAAIADGNPPPPMPAIEAPRRDMRPLRDTFKEVGA